MPSYTVIPVDRTPIAVAISPNGVYVYVTNRAGTVSVIDTSSRTVVRTLTASPGTPFGGPFGLAVGARVYVTESNTGTVSVIDPTSFAVVQTIPVGTSPHGVALHPRASRAYVANYVGTVSVIDTTTNTVVTTIPIGTTGGGPAGIAPGPVQVAVTPRRLRAYVTIPWWDSVSVIDTAANMEIATIPVGSRPWGVAVTPSGDQV